MHVARAIRRQAQHKHVIKVVWRLIPVRYTATCLDILVMNTMRRLAKVRFTI